MDQTTKNPYPNEVNLTLAFDVSTSKTGYAVLMNGNPFTLTNNKYSVGQLDMVKKQTRTLKDGTTKKLKKAVEYSNYGDKMFHGSFNQIQKIAAMVYEVMAPINNVIGLQKSANIKAKRNGTELQKVMKVNKVTIVYEVSEIPNFGKFSRGNQSITSVRKLALYVGAVEYAVSSVLHNAAFHFTDKVEQKFIKPKEWQTRVLDKPTDPGQSKVNSIKQANKHMERWGLPLITTQDDMADAINIASVADIVRDNVFAIAIAGAKKKSDTQLRKEIAEHRTMINKLNLTAGEKKAQHLMRITEAKNSKYDFATEKAKPLQDFLDGKQQVSLTVNERQLWQKEKLLSKNAKAKVIK